MSYSGHLLRSSILLSLFLLISCKNNKNHELTSGQSIPDIVDFNYHVKPILSDRCFACHGPDLANQKADLRLDTPEGAFKTVLESGGHAIVPGDLHNSVMYEKITSTDPNSMMPPPESNLKLSEHEIKIIKKWIVQGAEYKPHWAFTQPKEITVPEIKQPDWAANPIDNFIAAKLENTGLKNAEEASGEALIRRVTFDLTGLPPTPEDIDNFLADDTSNAYEKVVDRLLASPHYGERMATDWLDVARYADSHGYQDDRPRTMWPWRDWVIKAYNSNLPYDDFVTWQLAGDLMQDASFEQKLASGFNRNHAITQEGGVIEEEYLAEYAADRVQTFGTAFIGLTLQCARCHDHKYDPVLQKDFYQLVSFFNNITERGRIDYNNLAPQPAIKYQDAALEHEIAKIKKMLADMETAQEHFKPKVEENTLKDWFNSLDWETLKTEGLLAHYKLDYREAGLMKDEVSKALHGTLNYKLPANIPSPIAATGKFDKALQFDGSNTLTIGDVGDFEHYHKFSLGGWINISESPKHNAGVLSRRIGELNKSGYGIYIGKDRSLSMHIVHSLNKLIEVKTAAKVPIGQWTNVFATYDGSGKASGVTLFINGKKQKVNIVSDNLESRSILVGTRFTVGHWLMRAIERNNYGGFVGAIDEISLYNRALSPLEVSYLYGQQPVYDRQVVYQTYLKRERAEMAKIDNKLDSLRSIDTRIPYVMIMQESEEIKPTFVLNRGDYSAKGEQVGRETPEAILKFPEDLPRNRLGLAKWLFDERNPLTGRVIVNRFWQMLFGRGLVSTPEDFGNQGALPTHPELLDWLVLEFRQTGWDMKKLIKLMVMSNTYRQSAHIDKKSFAVDPENIYLSRGPYKKLTAEMIRDQALASSGLLNRKVGGKWVKPYQPPGIWKEMANQIGENRYRPGKGADLYRRSIYTYFKRTIPVPSMITLDAAERAMCTVKRQATSTPLQSLLMLNDEQYMEGSRVLAENVIKTSKDDPSTWATKAFKSLVSRDPSDQEVAMLLEIYDAELKRFREETNSTADILQIGDSKADQKIDKHKLAAFTIVVSAMLNLDETKHS
ncbi:DUF1553 domain-containing protein [Fulvivirgaceae bacterium BMA12]|uniref:DUF1553 domain-containing protein n=1 Tax=Agaribacillus aureus TaxID=3051825 RepID=A0ABT8LIX1_9BACT|nr:DUF1553 domain-containing protein [Fulvivirgaceae bacterium BMA12]